MSQKLAILFDLDGTLLDSLQDITTSCNQALNQFGYPQHTAAAYATFVGRGADNLLKKALPADIDPADFALLRNYYMGLYMAMCQGSNTLFPGVLELLERLHKEGVVLGVVSNKPHDHTCAVCKSSFADHLDGWLGQYDGLPIKPDPAGIRTLEQYLDARCVAYVGDSDVDVETGRNAGVATISVTWGLQPVARLEAKNPDHMVHTMAQLEQLLLDIIAQNR